MPNVITDGRSFPIQPKDIDASRHMFEAFGNTETEISAGWIVRFLQERGTGWEPFTYEEINDFYSRKFQDGFRFNRLVDPEMVPPSLVRAFMGCHDEPVPVGGGWIVLNADNKRYYVTDDFVYRCHKSSLRK